MAIINERSFYRQKEQIINFIYKEDLDIIAIQETWANKKGNNIIINGYNVICSKPHDRPARGLAIIVKNDIQFKAVCVSKDDYELEMITIAITSRKERIVISNVYIHPHATDEKLKLLESRIKSKGNQIILGDFNAHCKKWSKSTETKRGKLIDDMIKRNKLVIVNNKRIATMCIGKAKVLLGYKPLVSFNDENGWKNAINVVYERTAKEENW